MKGNLQNRSSYEKSAENGSREVSNSVQDEQMKIIRCLSAIYTSVYYIDLKENHCDEILSEDKVYSYIGSSGSAQERLDFFCHNMMIPEHTEEMLKFVDLSTLDDRMSNTRTVTKQYLNTVMISPEKGARPTWMECLFIEGDRDSDGKLTHVIFATQSINEAKVRELETQDNVISALSMQYDNVYLVNIDTLQAVCYRMGQAMSDRYGKKFAAGNFEKNLSSYIYITMYLKKTDICSTIYVQDPALGS